MSVWKWRDILCADDACKPSAYNVLAYGGAALVLAFLASTLHSVYDAARTKVAGTMLPGGYDRRKGA